MYMYLYIYTHITIYICKYIRVYICIYMCMYLHRRREAIVAYKQLKIDTAAAIQIQNAYRLHLRDLAIKNR
jgi:hypothetical protein